ncbi:hypothetical protein ACWCQ1_46465 [Streptomyces sp. NPDC002144]
MVRIRQLEEQVGDCPTHHWRGAEQGVSSTTPISAQETPAGASRSRSRDEHRRVEAVLAEANGPFLTDPEWPTRLIAALDLLRTHILKGQDGAFRSRWPC